MGLFLTPFPPNVFRQTLRLMLWFKRLWRKGSMTARSSVLHTGEECQERGSLSWKSRHSIAYERLSNGAIDSYTLWHILRVNYRRWHIDYWFLYYGFHENVELYYFVVTRSVNRGVPSDVLSLWPPSHNHKPEIKGFYPSRHPTSLPHRRPTSHDFPPSCLFPRLFRITGWAGRDYTPHFCNVLR